MKKIFALAALVLTLAACHKQEVPTVERNDGMITLTAKLAPKSAATKSISDAGTTIKADWVQGETLAILYEVDGVKKNAPATVADVNTGTGEATIKFAVEAGTKDGTSCTVIYPAAAAKEDASGVRSDLELLGNQSGALVDKMDIRVTTGVITPLDPVAGLVLDTPLAPKYAIFKLALENTESSPVTAKSLYVTIGSDVFVIKPTTPASELYVALPPVSGQKVIFTAMGETIRCFSKSGITIEAGKYYRSTLTMEAQSNSPDYVAMGDGLVWSTKNIGAASPEEPGVFYAWGEKEAKTNYSWGTYTVHGNGNSTGKRLLKYCSTEGASLYWAGSGEVDNKLQLEADDDIATQVLGTGWRIPTYAEWQAIAKGKPGFIWVWVTDYNGSGNNGSLLISTKDGCEGHCVFFPAAGFKMDTNHYSKNARGVYWASTILKSDPLYAGSFNVYPTGAGWDGFDYDNYRYMGFQVRGVKDE